MCLSQVTTTYEGSRVGGTACESHTLNNWLCTQRMEVRRGGGKDGYWNTPINKSTRYLHMRLTQPASSTPTLFSHAFSSTHPCTRCSLPQPPIYQINRITFPIRLVFLVEWAAIVAAVPVTLQGSVNAKGFQRDPGAIPATAIIEDVSETRFLGEEQVQLFVQVLSRQVRLFPQHQRFRENNWRVAFISVDLGTIYIHSSGMANQTYLMWLPPRKSIKKLSVFTWNITARDKRCSGLWSLLSLHSQGCAKCQQSKCFPFLTAHKSSPLIHSFIQSIAPINFKCLIIYSAV